MGTLHMPVAESTLPKSRDASFVTDPVKQEDVRADGFVDASLSLPAAEIEVKTGDAPRIHLVKEEELLEPVKEEQADDLLDASSSLPIDLEAKNGDTSLITEAMKKEEEQLEADRAKAEEEEEARKREEAAKLAFDPEARYSKLDELLTKTQLFSEFLLEKMDQIVDVCALSLCADCVYVSLLVTFPSLLMMVFAWLHRRSVLMLKLKKHR